jgi:hypothetical protein
MAVMERADLEPRPIELIRRRDLYPAFTERERLSPIE